jgi:hypothetical protein
MILIFINYHTHCIANFNNITILVLSCRSVLLEQPVLKRAEENQAFKMVTVTYIGKSLKLYFKTLYKGRFELHVNATIDKCDSNTRLAAYIIDCVSVESDFKGYPTNRGFLWPQARIHSEGIPYTQGSATFSRVHKR